MQRCKDQVLGEVAWVMQHTPCSKRTWACIPNSSALTCNWIAPTSCMRALHHRHDIDVALDAANKLLLVSDALP